MTQPQLDFSGRGDVRLRPDGAPLVAPLIAALTDKGWRTARDLCRELGTDDRSIREAASQSEGRVISGQKGYALIESVTVEEANRAAAWLQHQAETMLRRASDIRRAMHKRWEAA